MKDKQLESLLINYYQDQFPELKTKVSTKTDQRPLAVGLAAGIAASAIATTVAAMTDKVATPTIQGTTFAENTLQDPQSLNQKDKDTWTA